MAEGTLQQEFEVTEATEGMDTTVPAEAAAAKDRGTYELLDGSTGSRAAFIREKFLSENLSRKAISEKYDIPYRVVYSATVNMTNESEGMSGRRGAQPSTIQVTSDNKIVTVDEEGTIFVEGEMYDGNPDNLGVVVEVDRATWIKQQVNEGASRGDIAKSLGMSYGSVYSLTKDAEGSKARVEITLEDGTKISRAAYIRQLAEGGMSKSEIAKKLDVPYPVVWQATKTEKSPTEEFAKLVTQIEGFADLVVDPAYFGQVMDALKAVEIVVATSATEEVVEATEATEATEVPESFDEQADLAE
ncbi:MAG: hypothetical protein R3Y58_02020 [Eubacteriales bacterium]